MFSVREQQLAGPVDDEVPECAFLFNGPLLFIFFECSAIIERNPAAIMLPDVAVLESELAVRCFSFSPWKFLLF